MGLSGPKKRTKLSSDPNNTAWANSLGFGHKLLSAQGWKPGQLLGVENAPQADHYTAANSSHIRVMLREDNLGLGAQLGKSNVETFGLSTLSGIFGRLNGKSEDDVEKLQHAQRDVELQAYQTRKFGQMTFVRGGLLIGDKMEDAKALAASKSPRASTNPSGEADADQLLVKSASTAEPSRKKKRKHDDNSTKDKQQSRLRRAKGIVSSDENNELQEETKPDITSSGKASRPTTNDEKLAKSARKAARRADKEERRKRKEGRAEHRAEKSTSTIDSITTAPAPVAAVSIPSSTIAFGGSRQAVRQRFIQQKRLASMDPRALNEILMLRTAVTS